MKKLFYFSAAAIMMACLAGCMGKKDSDKMELADTIAVTIPDTALYGTIDEATTMHMLVINTDEGKQQECELDADTLSDIQGGVFAGDRVTVVTVKTADGLAVKKLLNLNTLHGKWTSLDRNFEIKENGEVESNASIETNPYTHWSTANANLILNADTFQVLLLGPDSLTLENDKGIFVYKRQRMAKK